MTAVDLKGRVAIITGAGSGIGRAVAVGYARAGAAVACVSRSAANLEQTIAEVETTGGRALALPADVCEYDQIEASVLEAERAFGRVDLLFAAAGAAAEKKSVEEADPQAFRRNVEVILLGSFHTAKAAIPGMKRSGAGRMVFVGSGLGHRAALKAAAYATSKAGLRMLVRVLAQELIDDGITVNELIPGPVLIGIMPTATTSCAMRWAPPNGSRLRKTWFRWPCSWPRKPVPGPSGQTFRTCTPTTSSG